MPRTTGLARLASAALVSFVAATSLGSTGCIKSMILKGQIEGTRKGSAGMNTTADYDVARSAAGAGIAQFEGMHLLAPDNEDAYYLLVKGYASYGFAFAEDDYELARIAGDEDMSDYHKARAKSLYTRAVGYGFQWLEMRNEGANDAAAKDPATWKAYLAKFDDKDDAQMLFWIGQAWAARASVTKEPELIGTLWVGRVLMERVVELDETTERGAAHVILGAMNSATGIATLGPEAFEIAKQHFEKANAISGGKVLLGKLQMAKNYACHMADDSPGRKQSLALYMKLLNEVIDAEDPLPEARLTNSIAKRRARRYLSEKWMKDIAAQDCGWDL
jgi:hypothetical protein